MSYNDVYNKRVDDLQEIIDHYSDSVPLAIKQLEACSEAGCLARETGCCEAVQFLDQEALSKALSVRELGDLMGGISFAIANDTNLHVSELDLTAENLGCYYARFMNEAIRDLHNQESLGDVLLYLKAAGELGDKQCEELYKDAETMIEHCNNAQQFNDINGVEIDKCEVKTGGTPSFEHYMAAVTNLSLDGHAFDYEKAMAIIKDSVKNELSKSDSELTAKEISDVFAESKEQIKDEHVRDMIEKVSEEIKDNSIDEVSVNSI